MGMSSSSMALLRTNVELGEMILLLRAEGIPAPGGGITIMARFFATSSVVVSAVVDRNCDDLVSGSFIQNRGCNFLPLVNLLSRPVDEYFRLFSQ